MTRLDYLTTVAATDQAKSKAKRANRRVRKLQVKRERMSR